MKAYKVKLVLEEIDIPDTYWGHLALANDLLENIKKNVEAINNAIAKAESVQGKWATKNKE